MTLTLEETIRLAQEQSIDAMRVRQTFLRDYWNFRSHRAELLPSLNLQAGIANFARNQIPLQDAITGNIYYRPNYNMSNSAILSIDQRIVATGGMLSLSSSLSRIDQYNPHRISYMSQPVTLSYIQPLFSYNSLKWARMIEPERYELAKREYLESMENVTIRAVGLFYQLALAKMSYDIAVDNYRNTRTMYDIARRRHEQTATVTRSELLQLELNLTNDSLSIATRSNSYLAQRMAFQSFLGYNERMEISPDVPETVPDISIDADFVYGKAMENGTFRRNQEITRLMSESAVAQARANRGISVSANANFGLSNSGATLPATYSNLRDQTVFGLSLRVPIMDWGMGRGRVKMAEAQQKISLSQLDQARIDFEQNVYLDVMRFNAQRTQLLMARRANDIAIESYELAMQDFVDGKISVRDLNSAQSEKDRANMNYITEMSNFWNYYYNLRKLTLYDFMTGTDIWAEFEKLLE